MPKKINNAEHYGLSLGIAQREGEPEDEFRKRVARAVLDEYDDPILATEVLVGKQDYHDFDDKENSLSHIVSLLHAHEKEEEFKKNNDTYFGISWLEFNHVLRRNGFERIHNYCFKSERYDFVDEYAIWADYNGGILLSSESFNGREKLNSAHIELELATPAKLEQLDELEQRVLYRWGLNYCSYSVAKRDEPGKNFLWLVDYSESGKKGYNYKTATQAKVGMLPEKARKMMGLG
ncbi:hypothetical protein JXB28_04725 [Candidatus Woesearchaeota archaeon]|nr:hypothetical protein [Candidatus Woesearchaeota archaeon]